MIRPEFGGIASPENDPASLRPLIARYVGDPERVAREGAAARAYAESTYAAPVVAEKIERLLTAAIARDGGAPPMPGGGQAGGEPPRG
jgi:glycosyltransferase involved in cell wall biosynthesis